MAKRTERVGADARYFVRFGVTALLLVSATLVLVLVVLPQRYVLSAGFRESGLNFPDPGIPFTPLDAIRVAALPDQDPPIPDAVARGPAEIFWDRVLPLLRDARYDDALLHFDSYLEESPGDDDVRRELAVTLLAAGRPADAVPVLTDLVRSSGDPDLRRLLARTLRDQGRLDEASAQYGILSAAAPGDEALAMEWARALAASVRYGEAEAVLLRALETAPGSTALAAELARIYYYTGRLAEAGVLLESMTEGELAAVDASQLREDVRAALAAPTVDDVTAPPPSLLEQAIAAREDGDLAAARALLDQALGERPNDADIWMAYANLLEYQLSDPEGARTALLEVERLGAWSAEFQLRLALFEESTGRRRDAMTRLERLQDALVAEDRQPRPEEDAESTVTLSEVRALLGDLLRYEGRRVEAATQYELALADDPDDQRAREGLDAIRAEVAALIDDVEAPGFGSLVFGLADTDDFGRFDLGGLWVGVKDGWAWSASAGQRWLSGFEAAAVPGELRGAFAEVAPARWWRQGTIRTALRVGAQWVREDATDLTLGAALEYRPQGGGRLTLDYAHGPAYPLTATLQSVAADVTQDRVLATLERALGERWSATLQADVAVLDPAAVGASSSTRLQAAATVFRSLDRVWSLGWTATALTFTEAAPAPNGLRLFWDPSSAVATGPALSARATLSARWAASGRVSPGLALIDERGPPGFDRVPQLSADARLEYEGSDFDTALDVFYAQARLEGYRTYGVRVSLTATGGRGQVAGR